MRIIYLDIDSLRPDHMSCYGYHRQTTPNIDSIAAEGVRFNNCHCASSPCVPSRASFMSGRFAINHGALTHWGTGSEFYYPEGNGHSEKFPFFPRYIREAGYRTITFSSFADKHHAWWFSAGWNEVHNHTLKEGNEDANEVNNAVIPWLKEHGKDDNYFLHVQYWDPHTMYTYPKEYMEQWDNDPIGSFPSEEDIQNHQKDSFPRSASFLHTTLPAPETMPDKIENRKDIKHLIDGYDGGINYVDKYIGELVDTLRELGIYDDVCFIISADHGESLGEQGIYMEHASATKAVHNIPLIIKAPGLTKGGSVYEGLLYNVDIMPTVAEMLRLPVPAGWDGESFMPAIMGDHWRGRDYLVMDHGLYTCQRAVRDRKWYFIRTYHEGLYHFDKITLYNLEDDPNQTTNLADEYPDIVEKMDYCMNQWLHNNIGKHGHKIDPLQSIITFGPFKYVTLEDWVQNLRDAGWSESADILEQKNKAEELQTFL